MSVVDRAAQSVTPGRRQRLRRWLGVAVLAYLGVLIVLLALERLFIFVPTTAAESWHDKPDPRFEDVTLHASTATSDCRVGAAAKLGLKSIPVIVAHGWSEGERRAYRVWPTISWLRRGAGSPSSSAANCRIWSKLVFSPVVS